MLIAALQLLCQRPAFSYSPFILVDCPVNSHPERIVIATRESRLALWQAEHVRGLLQGLYPACQVDLLGMTTRGDQILDRPLAKVGGKGLFVKELETALLDRSADIAVHSMKDVPMQLGPEFALVAIGPRGPREMALDAFVSNKYACLAEGKARFAGGDNDTLGMWSQ